MAATPHDGSGTTVSFGGANYVVTNITYNLSDPATDQTIDVSHLGLTVGSAVLTQSKPLTGSATNTGREVMIEYLGTSIIADASTGTLTITTGSGTTFLSKNATVASSSVTFALNDVVKGTATFKVAR
jgi:hypothetical protein